MMKNFKPNKDGSYWSIWNRNVYHIMSGVIDLRQFYPFPTLRFSYDGDDCDEEYSFDIEFIWLFWEILITKYWWRNYSKRNHKHE